MERHESTRINDVEIVSAMLFKMPDFLILKKKPKNFFYHYLVGLERNEDMHVNEEINLENFSLRFQFLFTVYSLPGGNACIAIS